MPCIVSNVAKGSTYLGTEIIALECPEAFTYVGCEIIGQLRKLGVYSQCTYRWDIHCVYTFTVVGCTDATDRCTYRRPTSMSQCVW